MSMSFTGTCRELVLTVKQRLGCGDTVHWCDGDTGNVVGMTLGVLWARHW